jgi:photosystem II stability/assembly factor-like uncharacterized protein
MKKQIKPSIKAHLIRGTFVLVSLALATLTVQLSLGQRTAPRTSKEDLERAREAWEHLRLQDEHGQIPRDALRRAYEQKKAVPFVPEAWAELLPKVSGIQPEQAEQLIWASIGPGNIGGRTRSIIVHPTVTTTMWLGGVGGGVWKTTNGGTSWSTVTDYLSNIAVNCMVIDPTNPDILYVGTGEPFSGDGIRGDGIFKTTDGGTTWAQLSATADNPNFYYVNRLAISPPSPEGNTPVLLAATNMGLWRSEDGGQAWLRVIAGPPGVLDVRFHPSDENKCIAGNSDGIAYYSTDRGQNWETATGLPSGAGRVELGYARSDPSIVYASIDYACGQNCHGVLYRSTNGGQTFAARAASNTLAYTYTNVLWIDPTNSNRLLFGGTVVYRSTDGGNTWTDAGGPCPDYCLHLDSHVIVNDPNYDGANNKIVYDGSDGGIRKTTDALASPAPVWTSLNHTLGITQFYAGCGTASSGTIIGGTQDNGTDRYNGDPEGWLMTFGGDGGTCGCDQTDPNYFYTEFVGGYISRSSDGGFTWQSIPPPEAGLGDWIAPFILDPNNDNRICAGDVSVWRSDNVKQPDPAQVQWLQIKPPITGNVPVSAVAVASGNSNFVWVGYNNGAVYYTQNGTAGNPTWTEAHNGLPARYCNRLTIGPQDPSGENKRTVYATFGGFSADNVWKTTDNGVTWTNISYGLPALPVYSLVISPLNSNQLYIGTQLGVCTYTEGSGGTWSCINQGPANTVVEELFWVGTTLGAATHGRSMFTAAIQ